MKVLYDEQIFSFQNSGGISKGFCELITRLPSDIQAEISVIQSDNIHLAESGLIPSLSPATNNIRKIIERNYFPGKGSIVRFLNKSGILKSDKEINQIETIRRLKEGNFDLFHPTFFDYSFLDYLKNKPFVLTIHDMTVELFPEYFPRNHYQIIGKKILASKANMIIAVSENTKKDIIELLNIPEDKIRVIYNGGPKKEIITVKPVIENPYFLFVGTRKLYKNFNHFITEFAKFSKRHHDIDVVCTGPRFDPDETDLINHLGIENKVHRITATDNEMKGLYANAIALIFPSLYEGFGLPILEAFAYGCPCILNNCSCFPEIANDAAIYFQQHGNDSDLNERLEEVFSMSSEMREAIIQKGYHRMETFSWDQASSKLASTYRAII